MRRGQAIGSYGGLVPLLVHSSTSHRHPDRRHPRRGRHEGGVAMLTDIREPGPLIVNGYRIEDDGEVLGAYDAATGEHATFSDGSPAIGFIASDLSEWCKYQDPGR